MPQVPIVPLGAGNTVIPYFASGSADGTGKADGKLNATDVVLMNATDQPSSGAFTFLNSATATQSSQPVAVTLDGITSATFPYTLPPRSSRRFAMPPGTNPFVTGWIQIVPANNTSPPAAFAVLSTITNFVIRAEQSISGQQSGTAFRVFADGSSLGAFSPWGYADTTFSIVNPSSTAVSVAISLDSGPCSPTGCPASQTTISIPPQGQFLSSPESIFGFNPFSQPYRGTLRFVSNGPTAAVAFQHYINQPAPFTVEAFDENAAPPTTPMMAHLPIGLQGYSCQIVILPTAPNQATTGTVRYFSQTGDPINP